MGLLRHGGLFVWLTTAAAGVWIFGQATPLVVMPADTPAIRMPAVIHGKIDRILRRDSHTVHCILHAKVDPAALPAMHAGLALRIQRPPRPEVFQPGMRICANVQLRPPRPAGLATDFDEKGYYAALGVTWLAAAPAREVMVRGREPAMRAAALHLREQVGALVRRFFPMRSSGMALALLTGDRSAIPPAVRREYSLAGTAHVLALSGMHVGIIAALLMLPLSFIRRPWIRLPVFCCALAVFTLATGVQPSTLRASLMAVLIMIASLGQRQIRLLNIVALTVLLLLLAQPQLLYSLGFQMSALSVASIAILFRPCKQILLLLLPLSAPIFHYLRQSLALTIAVSICIGPVVAWYFGIFSLVAPLANLIVVPLMMLAMMWSLCCLAVAWWPDAATLYASAADACFHLARTVNATLVHFEAAAIEGPDAFACALVVSAAVLYLLFSRSRRQLLLRALIATALGAALLPLVLPEQAAIEVLPRDQLVAVVLRGGDHRDIVLLQDRRPDQWPFVDRSLLRHLSAGADSLLVVCSGPAAIVNAAALAAPQVIAVIANSFQYKHPRFWQAIDSLERRSVSVLNGQTLLEQAEGCEFALSGGGRVRWNAWNGQLTIAWNHRSGQAPDRSLNLLLPRQTQYLQLP